MSAIRILTPTVSRHRWAEAAYLPVAIVAVLLFSLRGLEAQKAGPPSQPVSRSTQIVWGKIPLSFEPNRGQTAKDVQWLSRGPDFTLFLAGHDAVLEMNTITPGKTPVDQPKMTSAALRMNLLGAVTTTQTEGLQLLAGHTNYFHGSDPAKWQRDVPTFAKVRLPTVYPGVDLIYHGRNGHLEYDFVVSPGADPSAIRLGFEGAKPTLTATGDLLLEVAGKKVTLDRPIVYQSVNGDQQRIAGSFAIASNNEVTFKLGTYDHSRELTIDPVLIFDGAIGTGNNGDSTAYGMTVDAAGEIIFTGVTRDTSFPTTPGVFQPTCGTSSINPANNPRCTSRTDAFITKLSADGASLVFSTYLSGTQYDEAGAAVAVDTAGTIYVVGNTRSDDFPITSDAFQKLCDPTYSDQTFTALVAYCGNNTTGAISDDIFLVKINASGSQILYGTFLGGSSQDVSTGVALDPAGNIYISGITSSSNPPGPATGVGTLFPVTSTAYQTIGAGGNFSASLTKFSNDGHSLLYSTFFGTPSTLNSELTYSNALAVGANGVAFLGGFTESSYLPTTAGAIKGPCDAHSNKPSMCLQDTGFVAAFDTTQSGTASLVYSTTLGPPSGATGAFSHTYVHGLLADSSNDVFVTGSTLAYNFPTTTGAYQTSCTYYTPQGDCGPVAYLSKINPTGTAFLFSTFYGGANTNDTSAGYAIATDAKGRVYLYGSKTGLCDLPVLNPVQTTCQGFKRLFVSAFAPDASQLVFATEFGSPAGPEDPILYNALALDATGNIYFGGLTRNPTFPTTPGAYVYPAAGGFQRPFFAKISPVLVPTVTALTITPGTTTTGQVVTFTASVTVPPQSTPAATGSVVLTNTNVSPASVIGTIQLGANGSGSFTTSALAAGTYKVVATYSSDSIYDYSTSTTQTLTVTTPVSSTVTLTIPATSVKIGSPATLNVVVTGPQGSGTPTGTVFFLDGSTTIGSAVLNAGAATYTASGLTVGTHSISINYTGDNTFGRASSAAQTVTISSYTANVALSASPALAPPGTAITLSATIVPTSGSLVPSGKITFLDGATAIGSATIANGSAAFSTTTLAAGTHTLSASYGGDANFAVASSSNSTVTIRAAAATTTAITSSSLAANKGAAVTFTATISSAATTGTPTGTVTFYDGSAVLGNGTVASGVASLSTSALAVGAHQITAVYAGDPLFLTSTSAAIAEVIATPSYTVAAVPSSLTVQRGQTGSLVLNVTPSGGYTGTVSFSTGTLPQYVYLVFSPTSLTFTSATSAQSSTLTVTTTAALGELIPPTFGERDNLTLAGMLAAPALLGMLFVAGRRKNLTSPMKRLCLLVILCSGFGGAILLNGCSNSAPATAAPGTYNIPLTISGSDGTNQTLSVSIVIQ